MPASITNFNIYTCTYIETSNANYNRTLIIFSHYEVKYQINTIFAIMKYHINTLYIVVSNKLSEMAKFIK